MANPAKRLQVSLTAAKKKAICQYKQSHPKDSYESMQGHFLAEWGLRVGMSTIGDIWWERTKWLTKEDNDTFARSSGPKYQQLEEALWLWFSQVRAQALPVSDLMLKTQAMSFGEKMGITGLTYSNGWLQRFKQRHSISSFKFEGEAASANMQEVDSGRAELRELLKNYDIKDVYSMDETGLFYCLTPSSTHATGPVCGKKKSKDYICTSGSGTDKLKLLIIGKSKRPR